MHSQFGNQIIFHNEEGRVGVGVGLVDSQQNCEDKA